MKLSSSDVLRLSGRTFVSDAAPQHDRSWLSRIISSRKVKDEPADATPVMSPQLRSWMARFLQHLGELPAVMAREDGAKASGPGLENLVGKGPAVRSDEPGKKNAMLGEGKERLPEPMAEASTLKAGAYDAVAPQSGLESLLNPARSGKGR